MNYRKDKNDEYAEGEDEITGGDWLAPGQMKLYRIS